MELLKCRADVTPILYPSSRHLKYRLVTSARGTWPYLPRCLFLVITYVAITIAGERAQTSEQRTKDEELRQSGTDIKASFTESGRGS